MSLGETCKVNDCPVNARVESLKEEFDRHRSNSTDTHRQMFERIGVLERDGSAVREKLDGIDEKLDTLTDTVNALAAKPGKRWDGLADKLIYAAALAVVAWIAAGMPGLG